MGRAPALEVPGLFLVVRGKRASVAVAVAAVLVAAVLVTAVLVATVLVAAVLVAVFLVVVAADVGALVAEGGFRAPMMLMVLPQTLIGTWIGAWTTLPDRTPGEPTAAACAPESAMARPAPLTTTRWCRGQQRPPSRCETSRSP